MLVVHLCLIKKSRRLTCKAFRENKLVLHLTRMYQKFDFSSMTYKLVVQ